jgi:SAM-dependent methyltransferase
MSIHRVVLERLNEPSGGPICLPREHYDGFLARHYTWMCGGHAKAVGRQQSVLSELGLRPTGSGRALDLGCGSGFQTLALAHMGFQVTALDISRELLAELAVHCGQLPVTLVEGDIRDAVALAPPGFAAAVCMGDTLTHLPSQESVVQILADLSRLLAKGGNLVLTFRDLASESKGSTRFVSLRTDDDRIASCILEYEEKTAIVHDFVHFRYGNVWQLRRSSYRKLRLSHEWVIGRLEACGFSVQHAEKGEQMSVIAAMLDEPMP